MYELHITPTPEFVEDFKDIARRLNYEVHIDVVSEVTESLQKICQDFKCAISKNPDKDTFMLTHRSDNHEDYKSNLKGIQAALRESEIPVKRVLKEYCFLDDNISVDSPWLDTYNFNIKAQQ